MVKTVELKARVVPAQERSEKTYKQILDVSAMLLEEVGLNSFNTNLLAERAGIRIATVYRYFPNKLAILKALFERWLEQVVKESSFVTELSDPDKEWRPIIEKLLDVYIEIVLHQKGHLAIRRAVQAAPDLVLSEARMVRILSTTIVNALIARNLPYSIQHMYNFIEVFLTTSAQSIDLAVIKGKKREEFLAEIIAETKLLQISYLANYLD